MVRWNPADHPRDPRDGQFVERAGWVIALSDQMGSSKLPAGLDLDQIVAQRGFNRPAPTGTAADLDREIARGGVELWRGVHGSQPGGAVGIHRETREGQSPIPDGLYGRGIYTSTSEGDAEFFATAGWADDEPAEGSIQRLVLLADAKVLDYHVYGEHRETSDAYRERAKAAGVDIGTAAAYDGYDVVRVIGGDVGNTDEFADEDSEQYLLLNRAAAVWESR